MNTLEIIFILSFILLFYAYFGYGIGLSLILKFKKKISLPSLEEDDLPNVTHVIAAYNEEDIIQEKIDNCYMLDYPGWKINTIIVADGSSDKTVDIIKKNPRVKLYYSQERRGKLEAVKRVMKEVDSPITVFSDANSILNDDAIKMLVRHFQNNEVGAVAGEKVVVSDFEDDAASAGEGIYWKYESHLKQLDYQLYSVVGAAGELFAVRTHLFESPSANTLIEDFVITMKIAEKGYRVAYEPLAKAMERGSASIGEEMKRKVRISAGGLQAIWKLKNLLNPFKYGLLSFQYISHRVLRWTLAPLAILVMFITSLLLAKQGFLTYQLLFVGQILFYLLAITGFMLENIKVKFKAFFVPFYFAFMNLSVYLGLMKLITGQYDAVWEKAKRK